MYLRLQSEQKHNWTDGRVIKEDMKVLWIFVIVQTSQVYTTNAQDKGVPPRKCCNNEINLMHDNLCVADSSGRRSPIALKCEAKYVLDPSIFEEDHYNVTTNGSLHVYDLKSSISPDEWVQMFQINCQLSTPTSLFIELSAQVFKDLFLTDVVTGS